MDKNKAVQILKKLEVLRDQALRRWSSEDLVERFFLTNLNIFTSTFFFAIAEIIEKATNLDEIYMAYFRSRNTPIRFLVEQYLTMIHVAVLPPEERITSSYKYLLSGKLNIHKIDLKLQAVATERVQGDLIEQTNEKLEVNRIGYRAFLELDGKISESIPDEIDDFFDGTELAQKIPQRFGITLYNHGKINFMDEIKNNSLITDLSREFLLLHYPLLSMDIHPTHNSIVDFEQFIGKTEEQKKELAIARNKATATQLCMVGSDMVKVSSGLLTNVHMVTP